MQQCMPSAHSATSVHGLDAHSLVIAGLKSRLTSVLSSPQTGLLPRGIGLKPLSVRPRGRSAVVFALATEFKTLKKISNPSPSSSESLTFLPDIQEDFEIGEVLGEGQQGIVKEAKSKRTGQNYAVKIMSKANAKFATSIVKRMKSEAAFLADAQTCPFSVHLIGAYEDRENIYIVMDWLSGGSLAETLEKLGSLPEQLTAQFMFHVISFLLHVHSQGLCYGDIKPANFMLSDPITPILKAVDFGCCQKVVPGLRFRSKTGTPLYMAPEVHIGHFGIESDIWSAAVMMFQMLSGSLPFVKCDRRGVVRDMGAHVGYSFDTPEWGHISSEAKDLLEQLLVKDKTKRLTASEILQHPWFAKFRAPVSSNIISLKIDKEEANQAQTIS